MTAMPLGQWWSRFSSGLLLVFAFALLGVGQMKPDVTESVRIRIVDFFAPVIDAMARPSTTLNRVTAQARDLFDVHAENERLRAENARLLQWQSAVLATQSENRELRGLLNFKAEPASSSITARVIGDTGQPFVRSLIITAGRRDGVREGMAAMAGEGLVGRVIEVGEWSSRILLITDPSSRIPVMLVVAPQGDAETGGDRGILAGEDTARPKLLYLPNDTGVTRGMRVVTSGHGGVFPPQIPVGIVHTAEHGVVTVAPVVDLGRINYVRLIDFSLAGGAANAMTTRLDQAMAVAAP